MLLVSLLATVALVSMQYGFVSGAPIQTNKGLMDNNILSNVIPTNHRRHSKNFVRISHQPPETARHEPGVDLALTCGVMGAPTPQIQWLRNGEPVDDYLNEESNEIYPVSSLSIATVISTLIIREPSPNPQDIYTCIGTSGMMTAKASTTVFTDNENAAGFLQELLALPSKPRITYYYKTLVMQGFGSNVVMPCKVNSGLDAELYWIDNKGEIILGNSKTKVLATGDLLIRNVQWSEMGDWTCVVKNYLGEDSQSTFFYPAPLA